MKESQPASICFLPDVRTSTTVFWLLLTIILVAVSESQAATFEVGPGKKFSTISDVPWESLEPGDKVLIHWRPAPYKDKWVIGRSGTAASPIVVRGVPGPDGALPVVDGNGARTRSSLDFWGQDRSVIKIGGSRNPDGAIARFITIENLDVRGARPPNKFISADGSEMHYRKNAASIHIERGAHIIVRRCVIRDSGNGLFVSSGDQDVSQDILVEHNHIFGNGIEGSGLEHNSYTAAVGIVFQFNRYGPLRAGCPGINLKDRSAGTVVRYNWIEGGNLQLSLVDGTDSKLIRNDKRYGQTFVYGNILIEPAGDGLGLMARYGGDSGNTKLYRKGTLYFYNNTVVSKRTDRTTLFKLGSDDETCDFRNNIVYPTASGGSLSLLQSRGILNMTRSWLKTGCKQKGKVNDDGTSLRGDAPLFFNEAGQDYRLAANSPCVGAGGPLPAEALPLNDFISSYVKHQEAAIYFKDKSLNIGACETAQNRVSQ